VHTLKELKERMRVIQIKSQSSLSPDFHLSGPLKNATRGHHFAEDDELRHSMRACVKSSDASVKSFTRPAYSALRKSGECVLIMNETFWKNNINFVKDVPIVHVNVITILRNYSLKKKTLLRTAPPTSSYVQRNCCLTN
jgi:hypothetical protein